LFDQYLPPQNRGVLLRQCEKAQNALLVFHGKNDYAKRYYVKLYVDETDVMLKAIWLVP
jgi:hypothetical protein